MEMKICEYTNLIRKLKNILRKEGINFESETEECECEEENWEKFF